MKTLEEDNARLRADLAFFESLLPAPAAAVRGLVIRSFSCSRILMKPRCATVCWSSRAGDPIEISWERSS